MEPKHNSDYLPVPELPQMPDAIGGGARQESLPQAPEVRGSQVPAAFPASSTSDTPVTNYSGFMATANPAGQPPSSQATVTSGLVADDSDLIEKEWVLKAKAIVMQTRSDPHQQNIEMNNVKADYLKKRYNKDLKSSGS